MSEEQTEAAGGGADRVVNPDGTTNWTVVFEDPEQGILPAVQAITTEKQLRAVMAQVAHLLFKRKRDEGPRAEFQARVYAIIDDVDTDGFEAVRQRVLDLLGEVNLPDPAGFYKRYPHELSGGQLQRVVIAMAFACSPELLIMDEPTTGLDVTTEAHILDLVAKLKDSHGAAILYITHDLGVVAKFCHRVAVMYAGQIVEKGTAGEVVFDPLHPYARGLMGSIIVPEEHTRESKLAAIPGTPPNLKKPPAGCRFADRCKYAKPGCRAAVPLRAFGEGRLYRCILSEETLREEYAHE